MFSELLSKSFFLHPRTLLLSVATDFHMIPLFHSMHFLFVKASSPARPIAFTPQIFTCSFQYFNFRIWSRVYEGNVSQNVKAVL
jgi:hypothetical protein